MIHGVGSGVELANAGELPYASGGVVDEDDALLGGLERKLLVSGRKDGRGVDIGVGCFIWVELANL